VGNDGRMLTRHKSVSWFGRTVFDPVW
jgi:hypothetical protein